MEWSVIFHKKFAEWYETLSPSACKDIAIALRLLQQSGPKLGRPYVDTIKGSSLKNLKELRVQHKGAPYRLLFVFDPLRQAIILVGGNKAKSKRWYEQNIRLAEKRFAEHLREIGEE